MAEIDPAILKKFEGFYNHYCPEDLPILHVVLTSYQGREDALLEKLIGKYGPWPVEGVPEVLPSAGPSVVSNKSADLVARVPSAQPSAASKKAPSSVSSKSTAKSSASKVSKKSSKAPPTPASVHSQQPTAVLSEPAAAPAASSKPPSVVAESVKSLKSNASKGSHSASVQKQPSVLSQHTAISKKSSHHSAAPPPETPQQAVLSRQTSIQHSSHSRQPSVLSATVATGRPPSVPVSAQPQTPAPAVSAQNDETLLENAQLRNEISSLNRMLTQKDDELRVAKTKKKGASLSSLDSTAKANQREIQTLRERLAQSDELIRMKDRMLAEARQEAKKPHQEDAKIQSLLKAAFEEVTALREAVTNKDEYIEKLEGQLSAARQAILAATQTGFESDVKLHHAKTALNTLIDGKPASETPKRRSRHATGASPGIQTPSPGHSGAVAASTTPYTVPNLNQDWNSPPPLSDTPSPHRNRRLSPTRPKKY